MSVFRHRLTSADTRRDGVNSAPFIVLTYAYWHTHFQNDRGIVGRTVQVSRHPFSIIGVAPPEFRGTVPIVSPAFYLPIVNQQQVDGKPLLDSRGNRWLQTFGHLKPGVTPEQALADLQTIASSFEKAYPKDNDKLSFLLTRTRLSGDDIDRNGALSWVRSFSAWAVLACDRLETIRPF